MIRESGPKLRFVNLQRDYDPRTVVDAVHHIFEMIVEFVLKQTLRARILKSLIRLILNVINIRMHCKAL